ncbi:MAG TPA: ATP-dependent DNA helicase RecQ [Chitinophagaceae bacterium]|nr:ATP-dependent DNA helicase RecQ [Chitinophagaceae bacterium]
MSKQPKEILKQYWGHDAFRPLQEEIVNSILGKHDTLALLPTGGGKSVCFQVPAMAMDGICLVISPLIALMKDQVENLKQKGIPALCLFTGMPYREIVQTLREAAFGNCKFLYCSPERVQSSLFLEYLPAMNICFIAIDEAHCISQWGYDFRPSYLNISKLRDHKPQLPVLALTASATPEVRDDIMKQLKFRNGVVFSGSFARPNLSYNVVQSDSRIHTLVKLVKRSSGSGIVYCKSRKRTQEIADLLKQEKISADFYHAGLPQETRHERQENWIRGKTRFIVCTNAFGMGIDKPDVRVVLHLDCPDSLEHYYQEAGRAGRDGAAAYAVLLTDASTVEDLKALPASRYPTMALIRKIYQALGDYLQIASGTGEERYFDFDLPEFTRRFSLDIFETMYAMQALEQENIISMTEQMFLPSLIQFTSDRDTIEYTEGRYPTYEPLIKTLLRTYSGIWDQPTGISEKQLAKILRANEEEIKTALKFLSDLGILKYEPRKETPQVRYLQHRIKSDDLYINQEKYLARKKAFTTRVMAMAGYAAEKLDCRTKYICRYFGDIIKDDCGICDNCIQKKKAGSGKEEFEKIVDELNEQLNKNDLLLKDISTTIPGNPETIHKVISYLIDEGKIRFNEEGKLTRM